MSTLLVPVRSPANVLAIDILPDATPLSPDVTGVTCTSNVPQACCLVSTAAFLSSASAKTAALIPMLLVTLVIPPPEPRMVVCATEVSIEQTRRRARQARPPARHPARASRTGRSGRCAVLALAGSRTVRGALLDRALGPLRAAGRRDGAAPVRAHGAR